jgi:hypothetical protein
MPKRALSGLRLRQLAQEMVRLRNVAKLTQKQAAEKAKTSLDTVKRVEAATHCPRRATLVRLLDAHGADRKTRERVMQLSESVLITDHFQSFRGSLPPLYGLYLDAENEAVDISYWEECLIPGLLQTTAYAAAQAREGLPDATETDISIRVEARERRQQAFFGRGARLSAVVSDTALRTRVGGPTVMAAQLTQLLDAADTPQVTLQVLPIGVGAHPAMTSNFTMLRFRNELHDLVYVESLFGALFLENPAEFDQAARKFRRLCSLALPPKASVALIQDVLRELREEEGSSHATQLA